MAPSQPTAHRARVEKLLLNIMPRSVFEEIRDYPAGNRFRVRDIAEVGYRRAIKDHMSRANGAMARAIVLQKAVGVPKGNYSN